MPFCNIEQPEVIRLTETLRLKKYDGHYEKALIGYQDPYVYQNSEGIFDEEKKPDLNYVRGMCQYLNNVGELYFIEILKDGEYVSIGDVTVKPENPPIAIWFSEYRGKGIGTLVMKAVISRLRDLGYQKITESTVYKWNQCSLYLHQKLGFQVVEETDKEYILELDLLTLPLGSLFEVAGLPFEVKLPTPQPVNMAALSEEELNAELEKDRAFRAGGCGFARDL